MRAFVDEIVLLWDFTAKQWVAEGGVLVTGEGATLEEALAALGKKLDELNYYRIPEA